MTLTEKWADWAARIVSESDFFFQEQLVTILANHDEVRYSKPDFLFRGYPGLWRGNAIEALIDLPPVKHLILGHSDFAVTTLDLVKIRASRRCEKVWASNLASPFWLARVLGARPLPLGLTNPTDESEAHRVFGDTTHLAAAYEAVPRLPSPSETAVYSNFSVKNAPRFRRKLAAMGAVSENVRLGNPEFSHDGRIRYLGEMRAAGLVLCPRGNGHDTHRFYEALLMGAIPIVLKNSYSRRLAAHFSLPHIAVSRWSAATDIQSMRSAFSRVHEGEWDLSALSGRFWLAKLDQSLGNR